MTRPIALALLVALPAVVLSACSTAQVRLPANLAASATVLDVHGISPRHARQAVTIGPYTARMQADGGTFAWAVPVAGGDVGRSVRQYAFALESAGTPAVEVACTERAWTAGRGDAQRLSVDLTRLAGPLLDCELRGDAGARGRLALSRTGRALDGTLELSGGPTLPVRSTSALAGGAITLDRPSGYVVGDATRSLMVVDVVNAGRVHLDPSVAPAQSAWLAAAATALLLADPEAE